MGTAACAISPPQRSQRFLGRPTILRGFLKYDGKDWQVWTLPVSAPETAALFSAQSVDSLHG